MSKERQMNGEMTKDKFEEVLTTAEAAAFLKIPIGSFRNKLSRGEIKYHKIGRLNRFKKSELIASLISRGNSNVN
jgi:excisionase family DNA binding protein